MSYIKIILFISLISGVILPELHGQDFYIHRDLKFHKKNGNLLNYPMERIKDLSGEWKFEIGDNSSWSKIEYNDRNWDNIRVPSTWEDEGYPGYDGFAWYRTRFTIDPEYRSNRIYLYLGYIDDVDEVYLNGQFVGYNGQLPPDVFLTDFFLRRYFLPKQLLNFRGENILAVRVYDHRLAGGISRGKVGLYKIKDEFQMDVDLSGLWRFQPGDNLEWGDPDYDDSEWDQLLVPLNWEVQGYKELDGFAWYRKKIMLPTDLYNKKLILLLGLIDDLDATYLNGHRIGRHGIYSEDDLRMGNQWVDLRAYYIPPEYLDRTGVNTIAVRTYDEKIKGGIYDGPVGIVTQDRYRTWISKKKDKSLNAIIKYLFHID